MIQLFKVFTDPSAATNAKDVLDGPMIGEGPKVIEFTNTLKKLFQSENVIALNSCTSALTLALRLCNVKHKSLVLSTPFTMIATNCAVKASGAHIEWSDVNIDTLCMDLLNVQNSTLYKVDAVMLTLVGGVVPYGLDVFYERCKSFNVPLILDCAHALNTTYNDKHVSQYCDIACFSFQSIKNLHTVDGGAIVINDKTLLDRAEKLKWFGMSRIVPEGKTRLQHQMTSDVEEWGYKYHLNDVAASIGLGNYEGALKNIEKQRENAALYQKELRITRNVITPHITANQNPSWWVYGILVKDRDKFIQYMADNGIVTTPMWRRNDEYSTFDKGTTQLKGMDKIEREVVFIPNGWWLDNQTIEFIVHKIKEFYND